MKRLVVAISVALVMSMLSTTVLAQSWRDRSEAKKLSLQARHLVKQGEFKKAAKKFNKADQLVPSPLYKVETAKLLIELSDYLQATQLLQKAADSKAKKWTDRKPIKEAKRLLVELEERTPTLTIDVITPRSADATITINGEAYDTAEGAVAFNPGSYDIEVVANGFESWSKTVNLREGDSKDIDVTLKSALAADDDDDAASSGRFSPVPAYISWGVGAVGLGVGIGFGMAAVQSTNDVLAAYGCPNGECPPEAEGELDSALQQGDISTAGFIVGGAGLAAGTVLFIIHATSDGDEGAEEEQDDDGVLSIEAKPLLGPGYVGVHGTF